MREFLRSLWGWLRGDHIRDAHEAQSAVQAEILAFVTPPAVKIVSVSEFWEVLCDCRCVRLDRLTAVIGNITYVTLEAPERVPGLIASKLTGVRNNLAI